MRACSATYKLAIRFENWLGDGTHYWHPFGRVGSTFNGIDLFHFWALRRREGASQLNYSDYSAHIALAMDNKAPWPVNGTSPIQTQMSYAYHLDAGAFADYLKGISTREGVAHVFGTVEHVALTPDGSIAHVDIGGERRVTADLFIDASGFSSLLIEKALGDPWIDWSGQTNAWGSGLPQSGDNSNNYLLITSLLKNTSIAPAAADMTAAKLHFREMLAVRKSSRLLRLATKADVLKRVDFANVGPNQVPGVIALTVTDGTCAGADLDPTRDAVVAVLNATPQQQVIPVTGATGFTLHVVQKASADAVVKTASFSGGSFTVPPRTTAIFEALQSGAQGTGLPCNTH